MVTAADASGFAFHFDVAASLALDKRGVPARFAVTVPLTWPARPPQAVLVSAGPLPCEVRGALAIGQQVSSKQLHKPRYHVLKKK
jgi:hypothetical protein